MSTDAARREVIQSLLYRIGGMGLGFVATGVLIRKLGAENYGAWAALTSLLAWMQLSDFGVGHALKNRIAGASKPAETIRLVSGVFQFYTLIAISTVVIFLFFGKFLSIVRHYESESYILYIGTVIFFPLTIGSAILQGMRRNSLSSLISFFQSIFWVTCIFLLALTSTSLLLLSMLNVLLMLLMGVGQCAMGAKVLVGSLRKAFLELFNLGNLRLALPLWGVGVRFVLLQLTSVILFSLGTYITYSNLSPVEAAKYDILFKLFQVPLTFFNVVISVYWVEIARAISMNEARTLKKRFLQLHLMALGISFLMLLFSLFIASPFVDVYTGGKVHVSVSDVLAFWVLIMMQIFAYAGAVFLNAAENLYGQIILSIVASIFLIPIVLLLYANGIGISAVPLATAALIAPSLLYCNFSAYYYVIKKAY